MVINIQIGLSSIDFDWLCWWYFIGSHKYDFVRLSIPKNMNNESNITAAKVCVNDYFMKCGCEYLIECDCGKYVCEACYTWYTRNYCIECIKNKIGDGKEEELLEIFTDDSFLGSRICNEAVCFLIKKTVELKK